MTTQHILPAAISLGGVLLLILAISWLGRSFSQRTGTRSTQAGMAIKGSLAIDAKRRLHLVEARGRPLLILTGGGCDVMLAWPEPP